MPECRELMKLVAHGRPWGVTNTLYLFGSMGSSPVCLQSV